MKTLNYSRQREAIYNYLLSTKKHPTAETIFQAVQQDYPKISLATVYRNLTVLEETGQGAAYPLQRCQGSLRCQHSRASAFCL